MTQNELMLLQVIYLYCFYLPQKKIRKYENYFFKWTNDN